MRISEMELAEKLVNKILNADAVSGYPSLDCSFGDVKLRAWRGETYTGIKYHSYDVYFDEVMIGKLSPRVDYNSSELLPIDIVNAALSMRFEEQEQQKRSLDETLRAAALESFLKS